MERERNKEKVADMRSYTSRIGRPTKLNSVTSATEVFPLLWLYLQAFPNLHPPCLR